MGCAQRAILLTANKFAASKFLKRAESNCIVCQTQGWGAIILSFSIFCSSLAFHSSSQKKLLKCIIWADICSLNEHESWSISNKDATVAAHLNSDWLKSRAAAWKVKDDKNQIQTGRASAVIYFLCKKFPVNPAKSPKALKFLIQTSGSFMLSYHLLSSPSSLMFPLDT